ncbi:MAG TPA: hypothetical protein VLL25_11660 [Acidimicrobiales bacterium]|nr:hypothetical protein [Acidimicrobiales bacterium]
MTKTDDLVQQLQRLRTVLPLATRASIDDRHRVLEQIHLLHDAAMRWLCEGE